MTSQKKNRPACLRALVTGSASVALALAVGLTGAQAAPTPTSTPTPSATGKKSGTSPSQKSATPATPQPESSPRTSIKPSASPTGSPTAGSTATASPSSPAQTAESAVRVQVADTVRAGEKLTGSLSGLPVGSRVSFTLVAVQPGQADSAGSLLDCTVEEQGDDRAFSCDLSRDQAAGSYRLEVRLLDSEGNPVYRQGAEVVQTRDLTVTEAERETSSPEVLAQYSVTAAGYVMPVKGEGYAPHSTLVLTAQNAAGESAAGVSFAARELGQVPTVEGLSAADSPLTVTTDSQGNFSAYMVTSPYMTSQKVRIVTQDGSGRVSASDEVTVMGESVAELSLSRESLVAGENTAVDISGTRFAPHYTAYGAELQLVRDGQVVMSSPIVVNPPADGDMWGPFNGAQLTGTVALAAGDYRLQVVAPATEQVPAQYRGRVLAAQGLTVTGGTGTGPTDTAQNGGGEAPVSPEAVAPSPSAGSGRDVVVPEAMEPTGPDRGSSADSGQAARQPVIRQESRSEPQPTKTRLEQDPAWVQTSSIRVEDPRVSRESDEQLKSSVLSTQGTREAEARFSPEGSVEALNDEAADSNSSLVTPSRDTVPWLPFVLLLIAALGLGTVTGMFISRALRDK